MCGYQYMWLKDNTCLQRAYSPSLKGKTIKGYNKQMGRAQGNNETISNQCNQQGHSTAAALSRVQVCYLLLHIQGDHLLAPRFLLPREWLFLACAYGTCWCSPTGVQLTQSIRNQQSPHLVNGLRIFSPLSVLSDELNRNLLWPHKRALSGDSKGIYSGWATRSCVESFPLCPFIMILSFKLINPTLLAFRKEFPTLLMQPYSHLW